MRDLSAAIIQFDKLINNLDAGYSSDEWVLSNFVSEYIETLRSSDAFKLIDYIAESSLRNESNEDLFEHLMLILAAVKKSDTTEMSPGLFRNWRMLEIRVKQSNDCCHDIFDQLSKYYRASK